MFPIVKNLRRSFGEGKSGRRGRLRFGSPRFDFGLERFDRAGDTDNQSTATYAGDNRGRIWRILENLEPHCPVTGNEIVVIERMHERAIDPRKCPVL